MNLTHYIDIPNYAQQALDHLTVKGFYAYVVGGCVRDSLLGLTPNDWDICTSAMPEEIISCFTGYKVIETGIKHGTVTVIIDREHVEITTYRTEESYSDHRHPDKVTFTDKLVDDLARRDFTMNAIAYSHELGIVDPFKGTDDISSKTIKAVGEACKRFDEDSLRILRAIRFSATLGFEIEQSTATAIMKKHEDIRYTSVERQLTEIKKILTADYSKQVLIKYKTVFSFLIPELMQFSNYKLMTQCLSILEKDEKLRLSAFFSFLEHDTIAVLKRFKLDNATIKHISNIAMCEKIEKKLETFEIKLLLNKIGVEAFGDLLKISIAYFRAQNKDSYIIESNFVVLDKISTEKQCYTIKDLAINGNDLIKLGYSKNKTLSKILNEILDKVIRDEISNDKDELIDKFRCDKTAIPHKPGKEI